MDLFAMITSINHITLSVTNIQRSLQFYRDILGAKPLCKWQHGAYLELGGIWLCLNYQPEFKANPHPDYTHIAWSIEGAEFKSLVAKIISSGANIFQQNSSEGESLYFCDPDGHKLELHLGDWRSRIKSKKNARGSWQDVEFFV